MHGYYRAALNVSRKPPCPLPLKWLKKQNGRFLSEIAFRLKKSATALLCVKSVSNRIGLTTRAKMMNGAHFHLHQKLVDTDAPVSKRLIFVLFSPVATLHCTSREKSSINSNRKSTMRFPINSKFTSYVVLKRRCQRGKELKKQSVENLNN